MRRLSEIIYKVQFSKLCIDALIKRPKTTHYNLDICMLCSHFWLLTGVYMF